MGHRGTTPEIRDILRDAEAAGCKVTQGKRTPHWRIDTPNGPVFASLTPSSRFAVRAIRADLRRKGVRV